MPIARPRLLIPRLPLHQAGDGGYWTSRVSVTREEGSDEVEVQPGPPEEAGEATLAAPARDATTGTMVTRALGSASGLSLIP